jgi:capsular exopolysaccharide synthesis family protein
MNRVSEAMRRAGQQDVQPASHADEASFVVGDETALGHVRSGFGSPEAPPEPLRLDGRPSPAVAAPTSEAARFEVTDSLRIADLWRILYRRRVTIAAVVCAAVAIAAAYNWWAPKIYEARARVLIEPTSEEVIPFRPSGTSNEDTGRFDYYLTQMEILRSQGLARKALEHAKLLSADPARQGGQIGGFLGALVVTPSRSEIGESRVINIAYKSTDPKRAAQLANSLAEVFIAQNLELRRSGSLEAVKWLNQRLEELRREVTSTEGAVQQYREQKDAVALDDGQNIVVQKFGQLNVAVTSARAERIEKETLYRQLTALEQSGAPLDTFPPILANTFIQGLKAELAGLQRERLQLAERLGDLHPDMIRVTTAITNAQTRLNAETAKVVEGIRNDYVTAQAKEQGLASALESQKREVLALNQKSIGYNALQRDATSTQQTFSAVLQRAKETELAAELQTNNIKILDMAQIPRAPILPRTRMNLAMGFVGGCFLALAVVFGMERINPRIVDPGDVVTGLGLPLLGVAPQVARLDENRALLSDLPYPLQEAIRSVRTQLLLSPQTAGIARTFAVTSATPGEGKTLIASNLAISMALAGRRVLLVDADLRRPKLHNLFNIRRNPGLSNVITGETRPSEALAESTIKGLFILPAGVDVEMPADLLDSERIEQLLGAFRQVFDVVVLDCPPVMAVSDASIVASAATSVVFVVGAASTGRQVAQAAIDRLVSVNANVVGAVLNKADVPARSDYYYPSYAARANA